MKLAIVRQKYTPFGGAERIVERALDALRRRGVDVTVIARSWPNDTAYPGLRCAPFYLGRSWRDLGFARCVQQTIASGGFDLVQSHERIPGCHLYRAGDGVHAAWLACRAESLGPLGRLADRLTPYHRLVLAQERAMFAHPALRRVICNSRMVADELREHYGLPEGKLAVIYNGVDTARFHPRLAIEHRTALRAELGIADEQPLLLFVGNGFARKGVPALLAAAARMRRTDARIVVAGEDRRRAALTREAEALGLDRRVQFLGARRDVERLYGAADAFVLPSVYDPCPNAALEALACGLPTLVGTRSGAREWIADGANGYVVAPGDTAALAARLDDLCALGPAARQAARAAVEHLTLDAMSARLLALYDALLAGDAPVGRRA